jgi:prepilin-type N-terminal cleavage/methylation domain-containing protein
MNSHILKRGFTLIEIAIVMMIIGLLIGGTLVGRDLIEISQRQATLRQLEEINTAVNTFRLKFNCIPADCTSAINPGYAQSGDNDGILEIWSNEVSRFFQTLWTANLLPKLNKGNASVQDVKFTPKFRKAIWFVYNSSQSNITPKDTRHRLWLASPGFIGSFMVFDNVAALHPSEAMWFDQKIDDGYGQLGQVIAASDYYDSATSAVVPTRAYADPSPDNCLVELRGDQYDTYSTESSGANGDALCSLIFSTAF